MKLNDLLPVAVLSLPLLALAGFITASVFFAILRAQARAVAAQTRENAEALERLTRIVSVLDGFDPASLVSRLAEVESRKPITIPEPTSPAFVGASRRGQVLRLHRSGESAVNIAETLGVSQGEVDLTLKLQQLFSHQVQ